MMCGVGVKKEAKKANWGWRIVRMMRARAGILVDL
jgi:hypothetical protein